LPPSGTAYWARQRMRSLAPLAMRIVPLPDHEPARLSNGPPPPRCAVAGAAAKAAAATAAKPKPRASRPTAEEEFVAESSGFMALHLMVTLASCPDGARGRGAPPHTFGHHPQPSRPASVPARPGSRNGALRHKHCRRPPRPAIAPRKTRAQHARSQRPVAPPPTRSPGDPDVPDPCAPYRRRLAPRLDRRDPAGPQPRHRRADRRAAGREPGRPRPGAGGRQARLQGLAHCLRV
jgi:hypothetical protein